MLDSHILTDSSEFSQQFPILLNNANMKRS